MSPSGRTLSPFHRPVPWGAARRRTALRGALAAAVGVVAWAQFAVPASASPAAGPSRGEKYVALGDSFSSGFGIPPQTDTVCGRSEKNYPSLVAAAVGARTFTDVTCAGADTTHMTKRQESAPPQLDALRVDTTLVTLGIGGNDLDLGGVAGRCVLLGYLDPHGAPCKASFTLLGTDSIRDRINRIGPKVEALLKEIHTRSPEARVLLVGYPVIMPDDDTTCRKTIPLADGDLAWYRDKEKQLNTMLAQQANVYDATYVDTYAPSIGHDVCKPQGVRWIEPKDVGDGAGIHPNSAGHRAMTGEVLAALRG